MRAIALFALAVGCGRMPAEAPPAAAPTVAPTKPITNPNFGIIRNDDAVTVRDGAIVVDPQLIIENTEKFRVVLRFEGPSAFTVELAAGETKTVRLTAGTYRYHPEVFPFAPIEEELKAEANATYGLRFVMESLSDAYLATPGKGWSCAELTVKNVRVYLCARTGEACSEKRAFVTLPGPCSPREAIHLFRHGGRGFYSGTATGCREMREHYLRLIGAKDENAVGACERRD